MTTPPDFCFPDLRSRLRDDNFLSAIRGADGAAAGLRTSAELDDLLDRTLLQHPAGSDIHVFAYGSLMWNPALEHVSAARARVHGWHRSFCLRNLVGRGGPGRPGLMLALDRGGSCNGVLLRIPAHCVREELTLLWRREMTWGSYDARWVRAHVDDGTVPAVTFVVRRAHERYVRSLPIREAARLINTGEGSLGTCRNYFDATMEKLRELGIQDHRMEQLRKAVHVRAGHE
ncbi:MAG TPA: gamma-glutamylcyclotransferase [Ramlibacter sp.]|nr:gamma-glutamylcyclotransferase [Ramlibacter sp.]